jgi:two-component system, OmpR family, response regulator ChvI
MVEMEDKRRVLVVDDEADTLKSLKINLEHSILVVDAYTDPKEALGNFKPNYYDLIILDIRMPFLNGFELYSKLITFDSNLKVIFLTALEDLDDYSDFKNLVSPVLRKRHFVQKPISNEELVEQVYSVLN